MGPEFHVKALGISQRTWMATIFYLFGHAWRQWEEGGTWLSRYDSLPLKYQLPIVLLLGVMVKVIMIVFGHTSMLSFSMDNALSYIVAALCGSVMVVYISRWLVSREWFGLKFLLFTGRHTFEVLTWHFSCFKIITIMLIGIYGLSIEHLACFPVIYTSDLRAAGIDISWSLWWWLYLIVGAGVPILWQWVRLGRKSKQKM